MTTPDTRVNEAIEQLDSAIAQLAEGDNFRRWLDMLSRFHRYSFGNVLLIAMQRPNAAAVAGYRAWQSMGRQVREGEKAIKILAPVARRRKVVDIDEHGNEVERTVPQRATRFRVVNVFDVHQTDTIDGSDGVTAIQNVEIVNPLTNAASASPDLEERLRRFLRDAGVKIESGDTGHAYGWFQPATQTIRLSDEIAGDMRLKTLVHEAAHWHAGHNALMPRGDVEAVAEATAYAVMRRFGVDVEDYAAAYILTLAHDPKTIKRNLTAIQRASAALIEAMEAQA